MQFGCVGRRAREVWHWGAEPVGVLIMWMDPKKVSC